MCFKYKTFGTSKIGNFKIRNILDFIWMLELPTLCYLNQNINNYFTVKIRFTALGVLCYSMSLAADTKVYELATPVDLIHLCQVQSFLK